MIATNSTTVQPTACHENNDHGTHFGNGTGPIADIVDTDEIATILIVPWYCLALLPHGGPAAENVLQYWARYKRCHSLSM